MWGREEGGGIEGGIEIRGVWEGGREGRGVGGVERREEHWGILFPLLKEEF